MRNKNLQHQTLANPTREQAIALAQVLGRSVAALLPENQEERVRFE